MTDEEFKKLAEEIYDGVVGGEPNDHDLGIIESALRRVFNMACEACAMELLHRDYSQAATMIAVREFYAGRLRAKKVEE